MPPEGMKTAMSSRQRGSPVHGWIVLDKPFDVTSTEAVARVKRALDARKAGHAGTLDPLATGVLPIALGEATKTVALLHEAQKSYRFTARWGQRTDTDDAEGKIIAESSVRPSPVDIERALAGFVGEIDQVPPIFSAIKIGGERSYDRARRGDKVVLEPRRVTIYDAQLVGVPDADHAEIEIVSGKGAYVRALARDLAEALGTVAHASQLRRSRVGPFRESDAISLDIVEEFGHSGAAFEHLRPVETALDDIPALAVTGHDAQRLRRGQAVMLTRGQLEKACDEPTVYAAFGSRAVALGEVRDGQFHPTRVFNLPIKGKIDVDYE